MSVCDNGQLTALREVFQQKCFDIIEEGVESGAFRMKDVAGCLGISSQVASKLVNPTNPRVLTAFELFRMSILIRRPIMEIIPIDFYMTAEEQKDTDLCSLLSVTAADTSEASFLIESYRQLPETCRQCIIMMVKTMKEMMKET
ncbi:MAG: hypothetical protein IJ899_05045 [Blautia sp.]|nr:hypothetical protein [Blautia sp.]